jgi:RimJ/RimL family protein N-acetyltransferase
MINLIDVYDSTQPTGIRKHATEFLYELVKERLKEPDTNISHQTMPTMAQHVGFITGKPYRYWYLIDWLQQDWRAERLWVGYISATHNNEIGIVLQRHARGLRIGPSAVRVFMNHHQPNPAIPSERVDHWIAHINPANERSKAMFTRLGFVKIQETFVLHS